ncbi:MAG: hypothetical protein HXL03_02740 [Candidatus Nanosynbacter sp.]|nr:hypothetical protein [Candidatus Nanosynbacter sp.]
MVKSPDLLGEKISRRGWLGGLTLFAGGLALSACARESSSAKPANPSTADIPMRTADSRTTPPSTSEATPTPEAVEQKPLPNPEQIVSREKMDDLFTLPDWEATKASAGGQKEAADVVATYMVDNVVNGLLNPLTLVDESKITELGLGQHAQSDELVEFCRNLQQYVTDQFSELAIIDATQGSIPESLGALGRGGVDNTFVALTECGKPESLAGRVALFSRKAKRRINANKQRVLYYTDFPTTPHKKRIETTVDIQDNLEPKPDSAVCQRIDKELEKGSEGKWLTFDFAPPTEEGPMRLMDIVIKKLQ